MRYEFVLANAGTPPYEQRRRALSTVNCKRGMYDKWTPNKFSL